MKTLLERLGGARPLLGEGQVPSLWACVGLSLWWVTLVLLVLAFVGRSTKFVYVDF
jgi:hypothetical protein